MASMRRQGKSDEDGDQPRNLRDVLKLRREMSKKSAEERERKQEQIKIQKEVDKERASLEDKMLTCQEKAEVSEIGTNSYCDIILSLGYCGLLI